MGLATAQTATARLTRGIAWLNRPLGRWRIARYRPLRIDALIVAVGIVGVTGYSYWLGDWLRGITIGSLLYALGLMWALWFL